MWVGTTHGVYWLNTINGHYGKVVFRRVVDSLLVKTNIASFFRDADDGIWINSYHNKDVFKWSNKNTLEIYSTQDKDLLYPNKITKDAKGNLWFSADIALRFNVHTKKFDSSISYIKNQTNYFKGYYVFVSPENDMWIFSNKGGILVKKNNGKETFINDPLLAGLNTDRLTMINNTIYATNIKNDIIRIDTKQMSWDYLTELDGNPKGDITSTAFVYDFSTKKIWYASDDKLCSFSEDYRPETTSQYPIYITSVAVNNNKLITYPISPIHFSHDENNLRFIFSCINFDDGENNIYQYKVVGLNKDWVSLPSNELLMTILNNDTYELHYRAISKSNRWISEEKVIAFSISVPYWKTWWFISLVIFTDLGLFYFFMNQYTKNIKKGRQILLLEKEKELATIEAMLKGQEAERGRIASDLHDGLGAMLSGIKLHLSALKDEINLNKKTESLYQHSIQKIDGSINELRKISHNLMPESLEKFGLKKSIEDYCYNLQESTGTKIQFEQPEETPELNRSMQINLYRIIQELLNNATKHSGATQILVQIIFTTNKILLNVEDNGKGFDMKATAKDKGFGLRSIQLRTNYLKGSLQIVSTLEEGTSTYIEIPMS